MTLLEDTARLGELRRILTDLDSVVVAFSGGADSAFLAWVANDTLGPDRATAVTAVSPSVAGDELDDCRLFADEWGFDWRTVTGDATVVLGVNLDDHRPGQRAATERGARFPLVDAGFDKAAILSWSQRLGLRT